MQVFNVLKSLNPTGLKTAYIGFFEVNGFNGEEFSVCFKSLEFFKQLQ